MCGITGFAENNRSLPGDEAMLSAMTDTLYHRGPDDGSCEIFDSVGLGMRRLSIIDLEGGQQPVYNENRRVRAILNGEIYNYRELRRDLQNAGHTFTSQSDTEVIVHAYEEYGLDFPRYLNGMFAIALHDISRKQLLLIRDPLGIKPLYYAIQRQKIFWGSEIKAILASNEIPRHLNPDALNEFLTWEYIPGSGTLFRDIQQLLPGHILSFNLPTGNSQISEYWDIPRKANSYSDAEWLEKIDAQLKCAIQRQMVSDVPLGAFLSGGVDSSLIAAAMGSGKTFSIGFEDASYNELPWAEKVARQFDLPHYQEILHPDISDLFNDLMHFMDDPIGDFSIFPTYLISKLARSHVKVVLSGDGGDELFGGYETYQANQLAGIYRRLPGTIRKRIMEPLAETIPPQPQKKGLINKSKRFLEGARQANNLGHARWRMFLNNNMRTQLFTPEFSAQFSRPATQHIDSLFQEAEQFSPLNRCLYVDVKSYLSDNILTKVDRMSMAASLEARVPYLDTDLVSLAFQMPDHLKTNARQTKILLKEIASRYIPEECVYRPKQGFSIPIKHWLNEKLKPLMEDLLSPHRLRNDGIFNANTVARLKQEHFSGKANHSHILWGVLVFQSWQMRWQSS